MANIKILFAILIINGAVFSQLKTPDWAYNANIYEVNLRQFTTDGTIKSFQTHLTRLKDLGVDIIWLMPINPIGEKNRKGTLGSYYSVKNYTELNPEFGTKEDFKKLVDEIHKLGMHVIVDWVANHTAWDNPWVKEHPEYYTKDSINNFIPPIADWADVVDLNYDNKDLWIEMIEALKYWVKEFDIDGYRCDVAGMVPTEFWNEVRAELDKIKPVFMLAEWETPELHSKAFEMTYGWGLHKLMNEVYSGKKSAADIKEHIELDIKNYPSDAFRMQFTSNHDENTWNGTEFERLGNAAEMFAVLSYLVPGMPLIYNGQEAEFNRRLDFFEKDSIDWKDSSFGKLYTKLNALKKNNKALWSGGKGGSIKFLECDADTDILAFSRSLTNNKIIAIFNSSDKEINIIINSESFAGEYSDFSDGSQTTIKDNLKLKIRPWSYKIYFQ